MTKIANYSVVKHLMNPENQILLACTRKNFTEEHKKIIREICSQTTINWETVCTTAIRHKVAPLIYNNLLICDPNKLQIPLDVLKNFQLNCQYWMIQKKLMTEEIAEIVAFFARKSVNIMLLKGAALERLIYHDCDGYVFGDIDLILSNKREDVTNIEDLEDVNFFNKFNQEPNVTHVEWERFTHHDVTMNGIIPLDFQEIWDEAKSIKFQEYDVWVMSPEFMLLTACFGSARKRFFRLKSLCDIVEIINSYKDTIDWQKFIHYTKKYQCQNIVYTSLLITSITIGIHIPKLVIDNLNHNSLKTILIRYIGQFLLKTVPLADLLPSSGINVLGKQISPSLILPLTTYNRFQLRQKLVASKANAHVSLC